MFASPVKWANIKLDAFLNGTKRHTGNKLRLMLSISFAFPRGLIEILQPHNCFNGFTV